MNVSKHVMLLALGIACILTVSPYSAMAQEGEPVNADSVLMDSMTTHKPPQMQMGEKTEPLKEDVVSEEEQSEEIGQELKESLAQAKAENEDESVLAKKIDLAKKMHKVRPTREQVNSAVVRASMNLPEQDRVKFVTAIKSMLNYNAIERISIDAMVETFTLRELEEMVEYYSKPEAMMSSRKIPAWAIIVQPEISRMIDRALMRLRTGQ